MGEGLLPCPSGPVAPRHFKSFTIRVTGLGRGRRRMAARELGFKKHQQKGKITQPMEWEEVSANQDSDKGLISREYAAEHVFLPQEADPAPLLRQPTL